MPKNDYADKTKARVLNELGLLLREARGLRRSFTPLSYKEDTLLKIKGITG